MKRPAETENEGFWEKIGAMFKTSGDEVVNKLGGRIDKVEKGQEDLNNRTTILEERMSGLEERLGSMSTSSGENFVPKAAWLNNFCEYNGRRERGISRPQVVTLLSKLQQCLVPTRQDKVGNPN